MATGLIGSVSGNSGNSGGFGPTLTYTCPSNVQYAVVTISGNVRMSLSNGINSSNGSVSASGYLSGGAVSGSCSSANGGSGGFSESRSQSSDKTVIILSPGQSWSIAASDQSFVIFGASATVNITGYMSVLEVV